MSRPLEGKSAVVTGAGRGIGGSIAIALAAQGARVVVNDLGGELDGGGSSTWSADQVVKGITDAGGLAIANYDDVSDFDGAGRIIQTAIDNFQGIDILINNAGISRPKWFWEMSEQDFDRVVNVHAKGTFNCSRHSVTHMMRKRWGRIINISSGAAIIGSTKRVNYGAGKGAIFGMTNTMCRDLGPYGITVNAICPGPTNTRMVQASIKHLMENQAQGTLTDLEKESQLLKTDPSPPEKLAPLAVYLCTDHAEAINGQIFHSTGSRFGWYHPLAVVRQIYKQGQWTQDELQTIMPNSLTKGMSNPAPRK